MRITLSDHFTYQKLLRFTMPSIVMMIITSVYSIVDGFFVSNCVGKNAFAALNLIFPVLMALSAFGFMVGTGGSALIAKTLGEGKTKEENGIFSMLVAILAVGGAVLAAVFFVFIRPISYAVGATELTHRRLPCSTGASCSSRCRSSCCKTAFRASLPRRKSRASG